MRKKLRYYKMKESEFWETELIKSDFFRWPKNSLSKPFPSKRILLPMSLFSSTPPIFSPVISNSSLSFVPIACYQELQILLSHIRTHISCYSYYLNLSYRRTLNYCNGILSSLCSLFRTLSSSFHSLG